MSVRDVVADVLMSDGCGDSDQCDKTAERVLASLHAAGLVVEPGWMPLTTTHNRTATLLVSNGRDVWPVWPGEAVYNPPDAPITHWRPLPAPPETPP